MLTLKNERETLLAVAEKLESGEYVHRWDSSVVYKHFGSFFNMNIPCINDCGTVACIGGFAYLHENPEEYSKARAFVTNLINADYPEDEAKEYGYVPSTLYELFYPSVPDWSGITREQAATAIRRYLAKQERNQPDDQEDIWDHVK